MNPDRMVFRSCYVNFPGYKLLCKLIYNEMVVNSKLPVWLFKKNEPSGSKSLIHMYRSKLGNNIRRVSK